MLAANAVVDIIDPYLLADDAIGATVAAARKLRPDLIGLGLRVIDDCIPVDDVDAEDASSNDITWFVPEVLDLRRELSRSVPEAEIIIGGAGFSACPDEILEYLGITYGVVGAGEDAFREIVERMGQGRSLAGIPGVVRRGERRGTEKYQLAQLEPTRREPLYAPPHSFPVRTRIGCAMQCVYCTAANLGRRHANNVAEVVLDEIEEAVATSEAKGIGVTPLFFADDEFNLPDEANALAVLRGLVARGLEDKVKWRAYFNPVPISVELCELAEATSGHVSLSVDSAADAVLERAQKPFRRRHLDESLDRLSRYRVPVDIGLIFGLPGETEKTIAETIGFPRSRLASRNTFPGHRIPRFSHRLSTRDRGPRANWLAGFATRWTACRASDTSAWSRIGVVEARFETPTEQSSTAHRALPGSVSSIRRSVPAMFNGRRSWLSTPACRSPSGTNASTSQPRRVAVCCGGATFRATSLAVS